MSCGRSIFNEAERAEAAPLYGPPRLVPRNTGPALSYRCFSYDCLHCDGVDVYERACVCGCHVVAEAGVLVEDADAFTHPVDGQGGNHRERSLMADAAELQQDAAAEARDAFAQAKRIVGVE